MKKILIIGSGGREHAFGWALRKSPAVKLYFAPGNAGTAKIGENLQIEAGEIQRLKEFAFRKRIDLTVVGPENPLAMGIVNVFQEEKLPIFGPTREAAQIESSKVWARGFMTRHKIPGPEFATFASYPQARAFLAKWKRSSVVVKADGLAAGKGVFVCQSKSEAQKALKKIMVDREFGSAGDQVIIEERLYGREVSVLAFTDGKTVIPLLPAEDYKPIFDADQGPNTGGMGGVCPHWEVVSPSTLKLITKKILLPAITGMAQEGRIYQGILYAGLMMTKKGPQVLEFNCRAGDPENQVILPLLKTPLLQILLATNEGRLGKIAVKWERRFCVGVVLASQGYPGSYEKGKEIFGLKEIAKNKEILVFEAGTKIDKRKKVTAGGRVLLVAGLGSSVKKAAELTYSKIATPQEMKKGEIPAGKIGFLGACYRTDVGQRGKPRF